MKKVFLVKRNPDHPAGADSWIVMNRAEFSEFIKTPEGKRREKNFGKLAGCDRSDVIIVAECGEETAKQWRTEKDRSDYLAELSAESNRITFSIDEENEDGLNGEEIVADPSCDVELEVVMKISMESLQEALKALTDDEMDLIQALFLDASPMADTRYGELHGVTQQAVSKKKDRILKKLKKMLS